MKEKLDKIEFILEHLREPERLLEEEFVNWLQEEENKHLLEEVTTNRMAFLQKEYGQQIEPELEWQKLWQQMQKDFHTSIPEKKKINRMMLQEYIPLGQRVKTFSVEHRKNGKWFPVKLNEETTTIGYKRLLRFETINNPHKHNRFPGMPMHQQYRGLLCRRDR